MREECLLNNASKRNVVQLLRGKMGNFDFRERGVDLSVSLSSEFMITESRNCQFEASRVRFRKQGCLSLEVTVDGK